MTNSGLFPRSAPTRRLLSLAAGLLLGGTLSAVAADQSAQAAEAAWTELELRDPALADELKSKQGRLIADYGRFQLWAVPAGQAKAFSARRGVKERQSDDVIELHAGRLNTSLADARTKPVADPESAGKRLHLVQFAGPAKLEWHEALHREGFQVLSDAQPDGSPYPTPGQPGDGHHLSAGNSGPGTGSIGSPGTGKNVFTIGAAENFHSHATSNGAVIPADATGATWTTPTPTTAKTWRSTPRPACTATNVPKTPSLPAARCGCSKRSSSKPTAPSA